MSPIEPEYPDPGTVVLRLMLVAAFGTICFGAGVVYQQRQVIPLKSCVVEPKKPPAMPKTKAEIKKFIEQVHNRDAGWIR